jgi:hypothetical protein
MGQVTAHNKRDERSQSSFARGSSHLRCSGGRDARDPRNGGPRSTIRVVARMHLSFPPFDINEQYRHNPRSSSLLT